MGVKRLLAVVGILMLSGLGLLAIRNFGWGSVPNPIADGARLYFDDCAGCHGDNGNRIPVAPLNSWDYLDQLGDPYLVKAVSHSDAGTQPDDQNHAGDHTQDQAEAVVRYLRAPSGPAGTASPRTSKTGHDLYLENCASCHGLTGAKLPQAQIGSDGYVNSRGESSITRILGTGQGKMPSFADTLKADQTKAIIAYLRTLTPAGEKPAGALPTGSPVKSLRIPHSVEDRLTTCLVCHGANGLVPVPGDHTTRSNAACLACHQGQANVQIVSAQAGPAAGVPRVPHELKGREDCLACHGPKGILPTPASHQGRANEGCMGCHQAMDIMVGGTIPRTPHETDTRQDCLGCHKTGFMTAMPADHADKKADQCQSCHKPAPTGAGKAAPQIRHDIAGAGDCLRCHPKP